MTTGELNRQVDQKLGEIYRRHLGPEGSAVAKYYSSGRGYYPPELAGEEKSTFGVCLVSTDGEVYGFGDYELRFGLQSLSKVFTYGMALSDYGRERVLERVGVEPSGNAFNSLVFEEHKNRPFNPMVNSGALATTDLLAENGYAEAWDRMRETFGAYAADDTLDADDEIFRQEMHDADRNRATAYLMRSYGMVGPEVENTLALYLRQCSIQVNCQDLATMAATLANGGSNPITGRQAIERTYVRNILSVMYTCGMYDFAGEWAYEVGIPAKSGVSGGILAVIPGKLGIGVLSPGLDAQGNSVRGIAVCEELSDRLGLHVFADDSEDALLQT